MFLNRVIRSLVPCILISGCANPYYIKDHVVIPEVPGKDTSVEERNEFFATYHGEITEKQITWNTGQRESDFILALFEDKQVYDPLDIRHVFQNQDYVDLYKEYDDKQSAIKKKGWLPLGFAALMTGAFIYFGVNQLIEVNNEDPFGIVAPEDEFNPTPSLVLAGVGLVGTFVTARSLNKDYDRSRDLRNTFFRDYNLQLLETLNLEIPEPTAKERFKDKNLE